MKTETQFIKWFTDNATEFTFNSEIFYTDCELDDVELRRKLLKGWLEAAFRAGRNAAFEEAVDTVLYKDIDEEPWENIKEYCKLDEKGNVDVYWANDLDEEQQLRLAVAATLRSLKEE